MTLRPSLAENSSLTSQEYSTQKMIIPNVSSVIQIVGKNIQCIIDDARTHIQLREEASGELIGEMYGGSFWIGNICYDHNGLEISEKYRRQGFAKILFEIFTDKKNFGKLQTEYTRDFGMYKFYQSVGYKLDALYGLSGEKINFSEMKETDIEMLLKKGYSLRMKYEKSKA